MPIGSTTRNSDVTFFDNNELKRGYDADTGIQTVRSGQTVGDNIISSIISAYANLVYHPIAATMLGFAVFTLIAEVNNSHGPIELMLDALIHFMNETSNPYWLRSLAGVLAFFLTYFINHKLLIAYMFLIWTSYAVKPSSRNLVIALIFSFIVVYMKLTFFDILVISQMLYLFVMLRTPLHKALIAGLFFAVYVFHVIDIKNTGNNATRIMEELKLASRSSHASKIHHWSKQHHQATTFKPTTPFASVVTPTASPPS